MLDKVGLERMGQVAERAATRVSRREVLGRLGAPACGCLVGKGKGRGGR